MKNIKRLIRLVRDYYVIKTSRLFDEDFYLAKNEDVLNADIDPLIHYVKFGGLEGRNPSAFFDGNLYLNSNPDVKMANINPLVHYIRYGRTEQRYPAGATFINNNNVEETDLFKKEFGAKLSTEYELNILNIKIKKGQQSKTKGKLSILLVGHALSEETFGGELSFLDTINALNELGYNVFVTLPNARNQKYIDRVLEKSVAIYVFEYTQWTANHSVSQATINIFLKIIVNRCIDIVHVNTIMIREPLLASRLVNIPSILHLRELISHDEHLCKIIGENPNAIIRFVKSNADYLIANSEATASCFLTPNRLFVVPNTVDVNLFKKIPKINIGKSLRVGLISSNLPKKGIFDFIAIAKILEKKSHDINLIFIGPLTPDIREIKKKILNGELPGNIKIIGYKNNPVLAIAEVDIVVNLSHFKESFGRTVLESMAGGRPVIVYDWGALPELVVDGHTGYIVPFQDVGAVAERITKFNENRVELVTMGKSAQVRADSIYSQTKYLQAMRNAYDSILKKTIRRTAGVSVIKARNIPTNIPRNKLKIAYFCWHFPVQSETFVLNELRILREQNIDVIVFCKHSPNKNFKPDFDIKWKQVRDVNEFVNSLIQTGRNIIHGHFVYPTVTDMVWPAAEKAKIHFTCIAHAQDIFRYNNANLNRIGEFSKSAWCKKIFTLSRFHREYLINQSVPAEKIAINPNAIDPDLFVEGKVKVRSARTLRSICSVARFVEKKGIENLVRAGKLLAAEGITINIYGYGPLEELYRKILKEQKITNVMIHGPVEGRKALLKIFRQHDLFVCPSVRALDGDMDGLPTTLMESMASGLPVLTTQIGGIPDLVKNGVTGLICDIPTPKALAEKIRDFYSMSDTEVEAIIEDAEAFLRRNYHGKELVETLLCFWGNKTIDLAIVTFNNQSETSEVIRRLYEYTKLPFHLIICDNGSNPIALAKLLEISQKQENITLILNNKNIFVGPGTNICIEHGSSEYIIYVCGKEGFTTQFNWDTSFTNFMNNNPDVGLAGTLGFSPSYLYGKDYSSGISIFEKFRGKDFAKLNHNRIFKHVQGGFFVIRRKAHEEIGGFSNEVPHNYTDVEYSYHMENSGWNLGEIPEIMSLYKKTRPELKNRVNEKHVALHPPRLSDLPWLDRIAKEKVRQCNICGHDAKSFKGGDALAVCANCGSTKRGRTIYRILAESVLLNRRLPALGINIPQELHEFWSTQFQGKNLTYKLFINLLLNYGKLEYKTGGMDLIFLNTSLESVKLQESITTEISRLLRSGGELYVPANTSQSRMRNLLIKNGFSYVRQIRFSSVVTRFDSTEIEYYKKT